MNDVNNAIEEVKKLIKHNIISTMPNDLEPPVSFEGYQTLYYQTNENICEYLNLVDIRDKENALCVAGSGDQAFSLISKGIKDIQLFDVNKFTEYFILGLKKAMILKYDYTEYINILNKLIAKMTTPEEINEIFANILSYVEEPYKTFWQKILNYNYVLQKEMNLNINFMYYLNVNAGLKVIPSFCTYLANEDAYNQLKKELPFAKLDFKFCNAIELSKRFKSNYYDLILLSNILDYVYIYWGQNWPIKNLDNYLNGLQKIVKKNGIIFLHYIFNTDKPFYQSGFYIPYLKFKNEVYNLKNNQQMVLVKK